MAVIGAAGTTIAVVEAVVIADTITGDAAVMMDEAAIADRVAAKSGALSAAFFMRALFIRIPGIASSIAARPLFDDYWPKAAEKRHPAEADCRFSGIAAVPISRKAPVYGAFCKWHAAC
ncbi:hypothetical protein J3P95_18725 [Pseudomonas sp. Z5-35]|uniref:hypothetical protein n=1 Tax=unclassified Pseudomonas TaxID=196821 RepID=UPI003DA830E6